MIDIDMNYSTNYFLNYHKRLNKNAVSQHLCLIREYDILNFVKTRSNLYFELKNYLNDLNKYLYNEMDTIDSQILNSTIFTIVQNCNVFKKISIEKLDKKFETDLLWYNNNSLKNRSYFVLYVIISDKECKIQTY